MNGVKSVGIHVVGKPARTADTRNEDDIFLGDAEFGENLLHLGKDRIIAAPRTPADVLIRGKIFTGQFRGTYRAHLCYSSNMRAIRALISETLNGRP